MSGFERSSVGAQVDDDEAEDGSERSGGEIRVSASESSSSLVIKFGGVSPNLDITDRLTLNARYVRSDTFPTSPPSRILLFCPLLRIKPRTDLSTLRAQS